jgi:hypothetical protein
VPFWTGVIVVAVLLTACGGKGATLATKVDDLLTAGRFAAASEELRIGMPKLIESGKISELDEVLATLNRRLPELESTANAAEIDNVAESSVSAYFDSLLEGASDLPLDDICSTIVANSTPALDPNQSLLKWLEDQRRRQSAADYCDLLGLI